MPHIIVKLYPGRSEEQKKQLEALPIDFPYSLGTFQVRSLAETLAFESA